MRARCSETYPHSLNTLAKQPRGFPRLSTLGRSPLLSFSLSSRSRCRLLSYSTRSPSNRAGLLTFGRLTERRRCRRDASPMRAMMHRRPGAAAPLSCFRLRRVASCPPVLRALACCARLRLCRRTRRPRRGGTSQRPPAASDHARQGARRTRDRESAHSRSRVRQRCPAWLRGRLCPEWSLSWKSAHWSLGRSRRRLSVERPGHVAGGVRTGCRPGVTRCPGRTPSRGGRGPNRRGGACCLGCPPVCAPVSPRGKATRF
jgi:hypothetical protein